MKHFTRLALISAFTWSAVTFTSQAQTIVYDNLTGTTAQSGTAQANTNNPIFGDTLTLSQSGTLASLGLTLFNSSSGGNTGSIAAGTMLVNFYDNSVPYGGAIGNPLLGSANLTWDFTGSPLPAGFFSTGVFDLSSLNISLPLNILITQQFTLTTGSSTRNGVALFPNSSVGASPNTIFLSSTANAAGLYTLGTTSGQLGYQVQLIAAPEPATLALAGLGALSLLLARRQQK